MNDLALIDLGLKDYQETLELQYQLLEKINNGEVSDTLILVEHPHVITVGRKGHENNILQRDLPIIEVERGGDVTYHGPGQIVGYPLINISEKKDVNRFLRKLEDILILTLKDYNIEAEVKDKHTGVWINGKKIASIGVSFKNWISYHGFALNVSTDLSYFSKINPCGLASSVMTSMEKILNREVDIYSLKAKLWKNFEKNFYL